MGAVGIIAEYNPLHRGHLYQMEEIRRRRGEDTPLVIVLSGDFVQRGEAAVFSKFARAEAAVRCGASLVLELPLPWSLSSAEGFARGGVGLLRASGVVDTLCFGSESGDAAALERCAAGLESPRLREPLQAALKEGLPFAAARSRALSQVIGEEAASVLHHPNDLLGVEYLRAARVMGWEPHIFPLRRQGSVHDGAGSASELRALLASGSDISQAMPPEAAAVFARENGAGRGPMLPENLRKILLSRLRDRTKEEFQALPDAGEGIGNKLYEAARRELSPECIALAAKSKRYALSRLRRMTCCAALGVRAGMAEGTPPYARVLALDERGRRLLRNMERVCTVPIVNKPADLPREALQARELFELGSRAHDLYVLGFAAEGEQYGTADWRTGPYIHVSEKK